MTPDPYVYLSAADRQLETYLDDGAFERSLVLNLLLQPGILIPDSFFFASGGIARHLCNKSLTLLEAGLQTGVVMPSFRDKDCKDFGRALAVVRGTGDGSRPLRGIREDAEATAKRLDSALTRTTQFRCGNWPEGNVSEGYEHLVRTILMATDPPLLPGGCGVQQHTLGELWKQTEGWRCGCVEMAIRQTAKDAGSGLRRGCLMSSVARQLKIVRGLGEIDDIAEFFVRGVPVHKQNALHYFFRWITDIYQYNQAIALGATPNFPGYNPLEGAMLASLLRAGHSVGSGTAEGERILVEVPMPQIASLLRVPPQDLLAIRNELGAAYFCALGVWQVTPTSANEGEVRSRLGAYGDALVQRVRRANGDERGILKAIVQRVGKADPALMLGVARVAASLAKLMHPMAGFLLAAGDACFLVYRWYRRRPDTVLVEVGEPSGPGLDPRHADVNILRPIVQLPRGKVGGS